MIRSVMECVINVSVGKQFQIIDALSERCARSLLDVHTDRDYDRSVFTLAGPHVFADSQELAQGALELVDFRGYTGIHPALGALDVVPFVPLADEPLVEAVHLRDRFGAWLARTCAVPVFVYDDETPLPVVRKGAFVTIEPTWGPPTVDPRVGAACVGSRGPLVALNINIQASLSRAQLIARMMRSSQVRTLALVAGDRVQVSMNLIDPLTFTPLMAIAQVATMATLDSVELVGLLPEAVVVGHEDEYMAVGIDPLATIETRLRRQIAHP